MPGSPRVSVVCATPPSPNPGMMSVDLAFHALARRLRIDRDVRCWQICTSEEVHALRKPEQRREIEAREQLPFAYDRARDRLEEVFGATALVFWGDFLHMADYQIAVGRRLARLGLAAGPDEGTALAERLFLLHGAPDEILARTLLFGGTLLLNSPADYRNADYRDKLLRLTRGARGTWMRDVYSALDVSDLGGARAPLTPGVDCSLLLRDDDVAALPRGSWAEDPDTCLGSVGVYFGRSSVDLEVLLRFARRLSRRLGSSLVWLPWMLPRRRDGGAIRRGVRATRRVLGDRPPALGDLLEMLRRFSVVITDTYHVCLNAWRAGTPAICLAEGIPTWKWSVNSGSPLASRDKRQVFYAMNGALDFFAFTEELEDPSTRKRRLQALADLVEAPDVGASVSARILARRDQAEKELTAALGELLAGTESAGI